MNKVYLHRLPKPTHWALEINGSLIGASRFPWLLTVKARIYMRKHSISFTKVRLRAFKVTKEGASLVNSELAAFDRIRNFDGILLIGTNIAHSPVISDHTCNYV